MGIQMDALQLPPDSGTKQFFDWIGRRCILPLAVANPEKQKHDPSAAHSEQPCPG
jgi:hypothetical protein